MIAVLEGSPGITDQPETSIAPGRATTLSMIPRGVDVTTTSRQPICGLPSVPPTSMA